MVGRYQTPGGHIKENETPMKACVREMFEETGLWINNKARYKYIEITCEYENDIQKGTRHVENTK